MESDFRIDLGAMPTVEVVSIARLKTEPNPVRFPEGNKFLAVLPPEYTKYKIGVPSDREYVLVGAIGDALVFADWPNPICEVFRLLPTQGVVA